MFAAITLLFAAAAIGLGLWLIGVAIYFCIEWACALVDATVQGLSMACRRGPTPLPRPPAARNVPQTPAETLP